MNKPLLVVLVICLFSSGQSIGGELPVRYEVVHAPEGLTPFPDLIDTDQGLVVACGVTTEQGRDRKRYARWNVTDGRVRYWTLPPGSSAANVRATDDELLIVLGTKADDPDAVQDRRYTLWYAVADQQVALKALPDEGLQIVYPNRILADGRVVGSMRPADDEKALVSAIWDADGVPELIQKEGHRSLYLADAAGPYVVGSMRGITPGSRLQGFYWTREEGVVAIPLVEGCSWMRATRVDRSGRVLLNAKFYEEHDSKRIYKMRPYVWTANDGLQAIDIPDHWSAKVCGMNRDGYVLLRFHDLEVVKAIGEKPKGVDHLAITTLQGNEVMVIPKVYDARYRVAHGGLSESGAFRIRGLSEQRDRDTGAVLIPVYEKQQAK